MEIEFVASIDPQEKKQELHGGMAFAGAGILSLALLALLLQTVTPASTMFFFFLSPLHWVCLHRYRQMRNQEKLPDTIRIQGRSVTYSTKGAVCLSIPINAIARIEYRGGIAVFLKIPLQERLLVLDAKFSLASFRAKAKRKKCDLFFEWFSKESTTKIMDAVQLG